MYITSTLRYQYNIHIDNQRTQPPSIRSVNAREDAQRSKHKAFVGNTGLLMDNRQLQKINKKENVIIKLCTTYTYK